jgi:hypothetical protein
MSGRDWRGREELALVTAVTLPGVDGVVGVCGLINVATGRRERIFPFGKEPFGAGEPVSERGEELEVFCLWGRSFGDSFQERTSQKTAPHTPELRARRRLVWP